MPISQQLIAEIRALSDGELTSLATIVVNEQRDRWEKQLNKLVDQGFSAMTTEEKVLLENGLYIKAISLIRQRGGFGLKEAKMIADRYLDKYRKATALF